MQILVLLSALWVLPSQAEQVYRVEPMAKDPHRSVNVDYNAALASSAAQLLRRASDENISAVALHSTVRHLIPAATCTTCPSGCIKQTGCYQPSTNAACASFGGSFCRPSPSTAPAEEGSLIQVDLDGWGVDCEMCGAGTACILGSSCHKSTKRSDCAKLGGEWCVVQSELTKVEHGSVSDAVRDADAQESSWDHAFDEPLVSHHPHKKKHRKPHKKKHHGKKKAHRLKHKHKRHHSGGSHTYSQLGSKGSASAETGLALYGKVSGPSQAANSSEDSACAQCEGGCVVGNNCHVETPASCIKNQGKWCPGKPCGDCWGGCLKDAKCHLGTADNGDWASAEKCKGKGGMWCPETNGLTCTTCEGGCLIQDRCYMLAPGTNTPASNASCNVDKGQFCGMTKAAECKSCYKGCIVDGVCHMTDPVENKAFDKLTCDKYKGEFCAEWSGGNNATNSSAAKEKAATVHMDSCYSFLWLMFGFFIQ